MAEYLICGAEGFIGAHLVSVLIKEGHQVVCTGVNPS